MDRRKFFKVSGAVAAVALPTVSAITFEEARMAHSKWSGHAVGVYRPHELKASMLVWRAPTETKLAALTFDDGPDPRYTPQILDILAATGTPATFFMMGSHIQQYPDLARRVAEQYVIGNHSYSHPDMSHASAGLAKRELERTHDIIEKTTGTAPTMFRPPYGRFSGALAMVATSMGYDIVLWSDRVDSETTSTKNIARLSSAVGAGSIILAHDGGTLPNQTVIDTLPALIHGLTEQGISLVTVPELLAATRSEKSQTPNTTLLAHIENAETHN